MARGKRKTQDSPLIRMAWAGTKMPCAECKKEFERYSDAWAYSMVRNGKKLWFCSWRCYRAADRRTPRTLRGEGYHGD